MIAEGRVWTLWTLSKCTEKVQLSSAFWVEFIVISGHSKGFKRTAEKQK
jgi:hypothetical protein